MPAYAEEVRQCLYGSTGDLTQSPGLYNETPGLYNETAGLYNPAPGLYNETDGLYNAAVRSSVAHSLLPMGSKWGSQPYFHQNQKEAFRLVQHGISVFCFPSSITVLSVLYTA